MARRARSKKTARVWIGRTILLGLFAAALAWGANVFLDYGPRSYRYLIDRFCPVIKEVVVETSNQQIDPHLQALVRRALGAAKGKAQIDFSKKMAVAKIMESPLVEQVQLDRLWNGTLIAKLILREPFARLGDSAYLADRYGYFFKDPTPEKNAGLMQLRGIPISWASGSGDPGERRRIIIQEALRLAAVAKDSFKGEDRLLAIEVHPQDGYSIFTERLGGKIVFGFPPFEVKQQRLKMMLGHLKNQQQSLADIDRVDLNFGKQAVVRFKPHDRASMALSAPKKGG